MTDKRRGYDTATHKPPTDDEVLTALGVPETHRQYDRRVGFGSFSPASQARAEPVFGFRPHFHWFAWHVHPQWHGHCLHNYHLHQRQLGRVESLVRWLLRMPQTKPCDHMHWHGPFWHSHR